MTTHKIRRRAASSNLVDEQHAVLDELGELHLLLRTEGCLIPGADGPRCGAGRGRGSQVGGGQAVHALQQPGQAQVAPARAVQQVLQAPRVRLLPATTSRTNWLSHWSRGTYTTHTMIRVCIAATDIATDLYAGVQVPDYLEPVSGTGLSLAVVHDVQGLVRAARQHVAVAQQAQPAAGGRLLGRSGRGRGCRGSTARDGHHAGAGLSCTGRPLRCSSRGTSWSCSHAPLFDSVGGIGRCSSSTTSSSGDSRR